MSPITLPELRKAVKRFRLGKATGPDEVPIEYWKAVLNNPGPGSAWLLNFCNSAWTGRVVPQGWHLQRVAMVFKKGDPADCGNYRPICSLNSAYKICAMFLLCRLLDAGADDRIWSAQFGFRPKRNTEQACARRAVDFACSVRNGSIHLLALDWAKAFDSISPESLLQALRRFGLLPHFLDIVRSIYSDRKFVVEECGEVSGEGLQCAGVCQGCPLSPFLFGIVMTILMRDAYSLRGPLARQANRDDLLYDILYADDTLILGTSACYIEELAKAVETVGSNYGLTLHWGKIQALTFGTDTCLRRPDGTEIEENGKLAYLGGLISGDGRSDSELSRRLGLATADFQALQKVWSHSGISQRDKICYFNALVVSKLMYGLSTLSLAKAQLRRLDGFHARGLRRILKIPPAFISRVSNKIVFQRAGVLPLTEQLAKRQLSLLWKVAQSGTGGPLRRHTFVGNSLEPYIRHYIRKVGRPRTNWTELVLKDGAVRFGSEAALLRCIRLSSEVQWKSRLERMFAPPCVQSRASAMT